MIPSDLAARIRLLVDSNLLGDAPAADGTAQARDVQTRMATLVPGERFTAHIQRPLPNGTLQAIIAGKQYTLALNHSAQAGDTLELVVTKNADQIIHARLADTAHHTAPQSRADLSSAGRIISFLLTGQPATKATPLASGQALLPAPPQTPASASQQLAPALQKALSNSGLFYESHQQHWFKGERPVTLLLQEPQGQLSASSAPSSVNSSDKLFAQLARLLGRSADSPPQPNTTPHASAARTASATPVSNPHSASVAQIRSQDDHLTKLNNPQSAIEANSTTKNQEWVAPMPRTPQPTPIPERIVPLVQQQLDSMATQNYTVHGQAWPGQAFEWEIEDDDANRTSDWHDDDPHTWKTTLRLTMPLLGGIEAKLAVHSDGIGLQLFADDSDTVAALQHAQTQLHAALDAVNLPLNTFTAEHRNAPQQD